MFNDNLYVSLQALGNFYFIHESITDVLIYDFESRNFVDVTGKEIYSKNIEHVTTKEKSKFPLQYFTVLILKIFFLIINFFAHSKIVFPNYFFFFFFFFFFF